MPHSLDNKEYFWSYEKYHIFSYYFLCFFSSFNLKYLKLIKMDISVFAFKLFICSTVAVAYTLQMDDWISLLLPKGFTKPHVYSRSDIVIVFTCISADHTSRTMTDKGSKDKENRGEQIVSLERLPVIHRATGVACDPHGRNFVVLQSDPKTR